MIVIINGHKIGINTMFDDAEMDVLIQASAWYFLTPDGVPFWASIHREGTA